jgi:dienelactone hydrolase
MADPEPGLAPALRHGWHGPRVVVLPDGFPQTWHDWRHVNPRLVDAGRRVVAPDSAAPGTRGVAQPSEGEPADARAWLTDHRPPLSGLPRAACHAQALAESRTAGERAAT